MSDIRNDGAEEVCDLASEVLDFADLVGPNEHHAGFNNYRVEFPGKRIGLAIVAAKDPRELGGAWRVLKWSTYNV